MNAILSPRGRLILSMVIFGTIGLVRRLIPFPSSVVALVRAVIGLLALLALRAATKRPLNRALLKKHFRKLLLLGAMLGFNWILLFEAYNYTSVAAATMCYYMAPVIIILLSAVLFGEKITRRRGLCAVVAVFGMLLVSDVLNQGLHGARGLVCGLLAAALYAGVVLVNRTLPEIDAEERTLYQFAAAALVMLPYVLVREDLSALVFTPQVVCLLLVAGVVHTGLAYVLYFGAVTEVSAQTAALLSYIDPIVAVLISLFLLREPMSPPALLGVVLVLGAMIASEKSEAAV